MYGILEQGIQLPGIVEEAVATKYAQPAASSVNKSKNPQLLGRPHRFLSGGAAVYAIRHTHATGTCLDGRGLGYRSG